MSIEVAYCGSKQIDKQDNKSEGSITHYILQKLTISREHTGKESEKSSTQR